jgi:hypothetical protein
MKGLEQPSTVCICVLTAILTVCGTLMLFYRGVIPDTDGWSIRHETKDGYYVRIETGTITEDYGGQYIVVRTTRQHVDIYIDNRLILSSKDYGYITPREARYGIRVRPEFIGQEMRIVFSTLNQRENLLMGDALSFHRTNAGIPAIDYAITAVCIAFGIAALVLAFAFGRGNPGSGKIFLFALMNFMLAFNTIRGDSIIGYETLEPAMQNVLGQLAYYTYMWPILAFFYGALTGIWKRWALIPIIATALYTVAAFVLNATRLIPFALTDGGYNYILAISMIILTFMLALQPKEKNSYGLIARTHIALWTLWGLSAIVRLWVFDANIYVNIEYRILYGFALISITFYGIYVYAQQIKDLQHREYIMNIKSESLLLNYEQINAHIQGVYRLKHEIKNHLNSLHVLLNDNRPEEATAYLQKYTDEVGEITAFLYHENYLINAVAHNLMRRANEMGVKAELNLKASPNRMAEPDLISLLVNITDNALEACAKLPDQTERLIQLTVSRRSPYFIIVCKNSHPGGIIAETGEGEEKKLLTNKAKNGHGYGLEVIKRITTAYDGMMEVAYDDDIFTITVALKDK